MKIYGQDKTELVLTEKAQAAYEATDPLEIREYYKPGRIVSQHYVKGRIAYDLEGVLTGKGLTAEGVNEVLEDWWDDMEEVAQAMEGGAQDGTADDDF